MGILGLGFRFNVVPIAAGVLLSMKDCAGYTFIVTGDDTFTLKTAATEAGSTTVLPDIASYWTNTATDGSAKWVAASQAAGSALTIASGAAAFYVDAADMPANAEYVEVSAAGSGLVFAIADGLLVQRGPEALRQLSGSSS